MYTHHSHSPLTLTRYMAHRLQSAEEELKEVEGGITEEAATYSQDRAILTALQKTIEKLEVILCTYMYVLYVHASRVCIHMLYTHTHIIYIRTRSISICCPGINEKAGLP